MSDEGKEKSVLECLKDMLVILGLLFFMIITVLFLAKDWSKRYLIIQPARISIDGFAYSEEDLTALFKMELNAIYAGGLPPSSCADWREFEQIVRPSAVSYDIKDPFTGSNLTQLRRLLQEVLGDKSLLVSSFIYQAEDSTIQFVVTVEGQSPKVYELSGNIRTHLNEAAQEVVQILDKTRLLKYLYRRTNQRDRSKSLEIVQSLLNDDDPENDRLAYYVRGRIYLMLGDDCQTAPYDLARKDLERCIQLDKSFAGAYRHLGLMKMRCDSLLSAVQLFRTSAALDLSGKDHLNIGNAFFALHRKDTSATSYLDSARAHYERLVQVDRKCVLNYLSLAQLYLFTGNLALIPRILDKAFQMDANHPQTNFVFGQYYLKRTDHASAMRYFVRARDAARSDDFRRQCQVQIDRLKSLQGE